MKQRTSLGNLDKVISIVDDDDSFRGAITSLIRSLGHAAVAFSSAEEFLESDRLRCTACLITDVQMPGMSGIELQNQLIAQGHRLPVIFVAADPESTARGQALASGAVGFFNKPFREESFISCLEEALSGRKT